MIDKISGRVVLALIAHSSKAAGKVIATLPIVFVLVARVELGAHGLDGLVDFEGHQVGEPEVAEGKEKKVAGLGARGVDASETVGDGSVFLCQN